MRYHPPLIVFPARFFSFTHTRLQNVHRNLFFHIVGEYYNIIPYSLSLPLEVFTLYNKLGKPHCPVLSFDPTIDAKLIHSVVLSHISDLLHLSVYDKVTRG